MNRLALLTGLAVTVFASQAIWVTFSPASSEVARELGVSKERVGLLALTYPALFLALTIPSGVLLDRNFRLWLAFGVIATSLSGTLRLMAPYSYLWLLACQLLGALGQPFLLNSFAPFASRVFPEKRGQAVAALSFAMYLGIIYALGTGYWIYTRLGLLWLITPIAIASLSGAILFLSSMKNLPLVRMGGESFLAELRLVASYRELWLLGVILGLGVALFDNMSIWLEPALSTVGMSDIAGLSVALALLLGLLGVAVIPGKIAAMGRRTLYIRIVSATAILVFLTLSLWTERLSIITLIPLLGLVMLPAYPIIMEWISTFYPKEIHGAASGFIGFVSRIFTVVLASIAVVFIDSPTSYFAFLSTLSALALLTAMMLAPDK
ncbi:MAG: MFS transporter [Aeropyrum sp.]|nr:MFS transporter [Aeropyrum sp.]